MDPPLSRAASMRQNGCGIVDNHSREEASPMAQQMSVLGIDIAKLEIIPKWIDRWCDFDSLPSLGGVR